MSGSRDALLVVRCQLGERAAFTELVEAWHRPVVGYVRRMLGSATRADDVTQEIWLAVVRGLPRLRDPDRFAPWLFTLARRGVMNELRGRYADPAGAGSIADPGGAAGPAEPDPADAVLDRELVAGWLGGLPLPEREVLVLFHLEDLSLADCAEVLGVPVGTVKSRLSRARRMLRATAAAEAHTEGETP